MRYWEKHRWWDAKIEKEYSYQARSPTSLRPRKEMGELVHVCLIYGQRQWAFKTVAARDKFVDTYGAERVFGPVERRELGFDLRR